MLRPIDLELLHDGEELGTGDQVTKTESGREKATPLIATCLICGHQKYMEASRADNNKGAENNQQDIVRAGTCNAASPIWLQALETGTTGYTLWITASGASSRHPARTAFFGPEALKNHAWLLCKREETR